jgi:putative membrane protein
MIEPATSATADVGTELAMRRTGMLILGIVYHVQFMYGLRIERQQMSAAGLVHAQSKFPTSLTLITALVLLIIGCVAAFGLVFRVGPFA